MGDRTTQPTTTTATKRTTNPRALYGSSVESDGTNRSPWRIGLEFYDQRDSFTTTSSIGHDGYGIGPNVHPEEGSYAYARTRTESSPSTHVPPKPHWMFVHEPARNGHHNHEHRHVTRVPYGEAAPDSHHHWWDRIKVALHLDEQPKAASSSEADDRSERRRILIDVETALAQREGLDASDIDVSIHHPHEVTLEGTVIDRHSKRIAEEICEGIHGVRDVQNRLKIRDDDAADANVVFVLPLTLLGT